MPDEEKVDKKKQRFEMVELSTQTGFFIKDNANGEVFQDDRLVLLGILNAVEEIKKSVVGN
jgi:hypothetical protein